MSTITLKINPKVVLQAEKYAKEYHTNLSSLVENYLKSLNPKKETNDFEISSFVKSISEDTSIILKDNELSDEYISFLEKKYQ